MLEQSLELARRLGRALPEAAEQRRLSWQRLRETIESVGDVTNGTRRLLDLGARHSVGQRCQIVIQLLKDRLSAAEPLSRLQEGFFDVRRDVIDRGEGRSDRFP